MSTVNYLQYGLAPRLDPNLDMTASPVVFNVTLGVVNGQIVLDFEQEGKPGQKYIGITKNCVVVIKLNGDQLWLSRDRDAITTKEPLSSYYGGLVYDGYDKTLDRYNTVSFNAIYNSGGKYGTNHPFNINVDLKQTAADGTVSWVPLTIDPDIKNPPPQGSG